MEPTISVVIPVFNIESELPDCLASVSRQSLSPDRFETILVDDCSTDSSYTVASSGAAGIGNARVIRSEMNQGPGAARNLGIAAARGKYILFLDGDDFLPPWALETLAEVSGGGEPDAITFNWSSCESLEAACSKSLSEWPPLRRDLFKIPADRVELIRLYLGMNFDGSVIYTLVKRDIIMRNNILFPGGLHEDISVILKFYYFCTPVTVLNQVLYLKRDRPGSIVNTLRNKHIDGFLAAWPDLRRFVVEMEGGEAGFEKYEASYVSGVLGIIGVLLDRCFHTEGLAPSQRAELLRHIHQQSRTLFPELFSGRRLPFSTRYDRLSGSFLDIFSGDKAGPESVDLFTERYFKDFTESRGG
jgi:poly(ribitol-phosphate) beta-N-acetylglucosaminyltransferase